MNRLLTLLAVVACVSFVHISSANAACPSGQVYRDRFNGDGVCVHPDLRVVKSIVYARVPETQLWL
jgi:hypothetical protein